MLVPIAIALHMLAAVIWVGGMFFAYMILRPVAGKLLESPIRLTLWSNVFARFFPWVWTTVVMLPLTGYFMIYQTWGGFSDIGLDLKLMHIIGWVMIVIFLFVFFVPFQRMAHAIEEKTFDLAGKQLNLIRRVIGINLILGLTVLVIASAGRYI